RNFPNMSTGRHHLEALRRSIFLGIGALLTLTLPACASSSFNIADEDTCTASNCSDSSSTQESFTETNLETERPSGSTNGSSLYACASPRSIISWTTQKPTGFIE